MSQWTHISATIRIDALRLPGLPHSRPDLGNTVLFNDDEAAWDRCNVPCGSEGSLQHSLWESPEKSHLAAYVVTIWGDLRDYDDADEIERYLNRVIAGNSVRQGVAEINVEYQQTIHLAVDTEAGLWRRITPPPTGRALLKENGDG